jgi:hypothetical protein
MSKRVLVLVQRAGNGANVTDKTPTVVWEHEVPILEEIHGEGAIEVIEDTELILDRSITKDRKKQIDHIVKVNHIGDVFEGDPFEEYQRLAAKYGMHTEVRMSNVEKVYGSYRDGSFAKACGSPDNYEEMALTDLRALCDELGIAYRAGDKRTALISAVRETKRAEREIGEIEGRKAA